MLHLALNFSLICKRIPSFRKTQTKYQTYIEIACCHRQVLHHVHCSERRTDLLNGKLQLQNGNTFYKRKILPIVSAARFDRAETKKSYFKRYSEYKDLQNDLHFPLKPIPPRRPPNGPPL